MTHEKNQSIEADNVKMQDLKEKLDKMSGNIQKSQQRSRNDSGGENGNSRKEKHTSI